MTQYYEKLKNVMIREASKNDNLQAQPRYGLVEDYDPNTNLVKCSILPEVNDDGDKILTNWLQINSALVGPGWGIVAPLTPGEGEEDGDQVVLLPMNNSGSEYLVMGASFNETDEVAKGPNDIGGADETTEVGEYLIRSKSGFTAKWVDGSTLMIKGDYHKEEVLHIITKGTDLHITTSDFVQVDCKTALVTATDTITLTAPQVIVNGHLQVNGSINATHDITDDLSSMQTIREVFDVHVHDEDSDPPLQQLPIK